MVKQCLDKASMEVQFFQHLLKGVNEMFTAINGL